MNKNIFLPVAAFICLCISSCHPEDKEKTAGTQTRTTPLDKQLAGKFIDSINLKFTEQFRAGDSVALASHYWPDAELLFANSEPIKGRDILLTWGAMTHMGVKDFTFSTTDITGDESFIIETGKYEMKDGKGTLVDKGKYVVVWQNRNGEWKLYRDIGNTSMPAAK
jgi:ketosteroid isomerase-like protein